MLVSGNLASIIAYRSSSSDSVPLIFGIFVNRIGIGGNPSVSKSISLLSGFSINGIRVLSEPNLKFRELLADFKKFQLNFFLVDLEA